MKHIEELIKALPGVEFVHIHYNPNQATDKTTGQAGGTFKVYVKGGKKKDIANLIWLHKYIGSLSQGNTRVKVKDCCGYKHMISFERLL